MQNTTVVGIVVAVIIIFWGLRIILRKSDDARPSLETPLQLNEESQLPIIPRHVRDQLQGQAVEVNADQSVAAADPTSTVQVVEPAVETAVSAEAAVAATETATAVEDVVAQKSAQTETVAATAPIEEFNLNPNIETAEIKEFEDESSILDKHLHEQQRFDDESSLANAASIIALNVYPNPRNALSGDKTLKVLF